VLEPRVVPRIIFDNWEFQTFDFGAKMAKTRGRNARKHTFMERCAYTGALGAHLQRASVGCCTSGARRLGQSNMLVAPCSGAWGQSCRGP